MLPNSIYQFCVILMVMKEAIFLSEKTDFKKLEIKKKIENCSIYADLKCNIISINRGKFTR